MKVILLQDVPKIGHKNEVKEVNQGYATNFLFPKKLAVSATPAAIKRLEQRNQEAQAHAQIAEELIEKTIHQLKGKKVVITEKANPRGGLFSQVHTDEIVAAAKEQLQETLDTSWVQLADPIKATGEYKVTIAHGSHGVDLTVVVEAA